MPYRLTPPPQNPLARLLAGLRAVAALVGALFFGLVVVALVAGLGLIAWIALSARLWWLRRQMQRTGAPLHGTGREQGANPGGAGRSGKGKVIDADYEVISRDREN